MAEQARVKSRESLARALYEAVRSGDVENVKRVADLVHEAGIDPVDILVSIALEAQPDSSVRSVAILTLESLDSAALRRFEVPLASDALQGPGSLSSDEPKEGSIERQEVENPQIVYLQIKDKISPFSVKEVESLLIKRAITADLLAFSPDTEWCPLRSMPQLHQSIRNAYSELYGPQRAVKRLPASLVDGFNCRIGRHKFKEWRYVSEMSCETRRHCDYCSKTTPGEVMHVYGVATYLKDGECEIGEPCLRCSHSVAKSIKHEWGDWSYPEDGRCGTTRACSRCGAKEAGEVKHAFGTWREHNKCTTVRTCTRCKKYEFSSRHSWSVWMYESPTSCVQVRFCKRCDEQDFDIKLEHKWRKVRSPYEDEFIEQCMHCGKIL